MARSDCSPIEIVILNRASWSFDLKQTGNGTVQDFILVTNEELVITSNTINANNVKEITEAVNFSKQFAIKNTVIVGGKDSWMITDLLKENNISVIVNRVHDLPEKAEEDIDLPFKLPYLLQKAGILFCLNNEGDMEAMGTRNLPFMAGTAAAYGLTKEQALKAITSNTAKILGIDKTTGTI